MMDSSEGKSKKKIYEDLAYKFLYEHHSVDLEEILKSEDSQEHFSLSILYLRLFEECPILGESLLTSPELVLDAFDKSAKRCLLQKCDDLSVANSSLILKRNVHVRIHALPSFSQFYRMEFPGSRDVGSYMSILGTVVRTTSAKLLEYAKLYRCTKCKSGFDVYSDIGKFNAFPNPKSLSCPNLCLNGKIVPAVQEGENPMEFSKFKDYQEIKLQEQIMKLDFGPLSKSMFVILQDDLVDKCKPGDDVEICGRVILRWKPTKVGQQCDIELAFVANHIQVNNDQKSGVYLTNEMKESFEKFWEEHKENPFEGRNQIVASFCPEIYGMYVVKLGLCMVLAGGVERIKGPTRIRGESHLLLVGDPGTGKSQLLRFASKISPRSVHTTGIGTTTAGLTVSAVKDGGEWTLEAGALVLADGGVCCIDEFSCIKEADRTSIHEAMEQQSISVAKAGMVCNLTTRCTVIASTNPKGKYDPNSSLELNVALASPLLSRFDVVIVLRDAQNEAWDNLVCDFILAGNSIDSRLLGSTSGNKKWDSERLQGYLVHIKDIKPVLSENAKRVVSAYYIFQRNSRDRNAARTTVRLFESLIRLAEGHARLMMRNNVTVYDAVNAVALIESSMQASALISQTDCLHTFFPEDPFKEYRIQAKVILTKLQLEDLLKVELEWLNSLQEKLNEGQPAKKRRIEIQNCDMSEEKPIELKPAIISKAEEPGIVEVEKRGKRKVEVIKLPFPKLNQSRENSVHKSANCHDLKNLNISANISQVELNIPQSVIRENEGGKSKRSNVPCDEEFIQEINNLCGNSQSLTLNSQSLPLNVKIGVLNERIGDLNEKIEINDQSGEYEYLDEDIFKDEDDGIEALFTQIEERREKKFLVESQESQDSQEDETAAGKERKRLREEKHKMEIRRKLERFKNNK